MPAVASSISSYERRLLLEAKVVFASLWPKTEVTLLSVSVDRENSFSLAETPTCSRLPGADAAFRTCQRNELRLRCIRSFMLDMFSIGAV